MLELTNGAKPFKSHLELARRVKGVTVDEISMSLGWGWGWVALGVGAIVNSLLPYSVHEIQLHREFQTFSRTLKLTWPLASAPAGNHSGLNRHSGIFH